MNDLTVLDYAKFSFYFLALVDLLPFPNKFLLDCNCLIVKVSFFASNGCDIICWAPEECRLTRGGQNWLQIYKLIINFTNQCLKILCLSLDKECCTFFVMLAPAAQQHPVALIIIRRGLYPKLSPVISYPCPCFPRVVLA